MVPSSATCGTAAVMQVSRSRAYPPFFCQFARFSWLLADRAGRNNGVVPAMITFESPPPGCDVSWPVSVSAAIASVTFRWRSGLIASIVVTEVAKNRPRCCCTSRSRNYQIINWYRKKSNKKVPKDFSFKLFSYWSFTLRAIRWILN